jgi:outer membrane protein OmpA-like peptidoglycan-associated protein
VRTPSSHSVSTSGRSVIVAVALALLGSSIQPAAAPPQAAPASATEPSFEAYSKYDFVPGEKVVALDDFSQDAIGDFPAKWNTNGSGEVVTLAGKPGRWLKVTRGGFFIPDFITDIPDNFTLEFDFTVAPTFDSSYALNVALAQLANPKQPAPWQSSDNLFTVTVNPRPGGGASGMTTRENGSSAAGNSTSASQLNAKSNTPIHISVWRQRQRVRVYINQEKTWDVPRALLATAKLNALLFSLPNVDANHEYYITNVRVATGAPDTRNKMLTQGKWVSHGILFDVNSDRLKGESYGSLKEIAGVLSETADLKVQIVGHTDSDGDDKSNLDLSRRRAASVKAALAAQFGIDAGRMDTDGKGEGEPVDKNDTPAGKANNRRVEFIKK